MTNQGLDPAAWLERQKELNEPRVGVLPSGLKASWRKHLSMESLVFQGVLPLPILEDLQEEFGEGEIDLSMSEVLGNPEKFTGLIDVLFAAAMVNPRVSLEDEVDMEADPPVLPLSAWSNAVEDKVYVMQDVMEDVDDVRPFREGEEERAGDPPSGEQSLRPKAVEDGRHPEPVGGD